MIPCFRPHQQRVKVLRYLFYINSVHTKFIKCKTLYAPEKIIVQMQARTACLEKVTRTSSWLQDMILEAIKGLLTEAGLFQVEHDLQHFGATSSCK